MTISGGTSLIVGIGVGKAVGVIGRWIGKCFVAGTAVQLSNGKTKPIEHIKPGDLVKTRSDSAGENGGVTCGKVKRIFSHDHTGTIELRFSDGSRVETTAEHPFYVSGTGWRQAGQLAIGTSIVTRAGPPVKVAGVVQHSATKRVYNFEVEDAHTYFVGETDGGLWVHNACGADGPWYRGAEPGEPPNFDLKPGEVKVGNDGMVQPGKGPSVNLEPGNLPTAYGDAYPITDLPPGLIIRIGKGTHGVITSTEPLPIGELQRLLDLVQVGSKAN